LAQVEVVPVMTSIESCAPIGVPRVRRNTVQLVERMVGVGGPVGCGQARCRARLTCHLTYLRLVSRGLERRRRAGLSRRHSRVRAWRHPWSLR
jgi:hypothetical protein